jgi:hypothetical protein
MPNVLLKTVRIPRPAAILAIGLVTVALIGGSLVMDTTGQSAADQYVVERWSVAGLRIYLWLEAGLLAGVVAALGVYVVSTGFRVIRWVKSGLSAEATRDSLRVAAGFGYVFVVLGAALVALSLTMLVALNSCQYMRLIRFD